MQRSFSTVQWKLTYVSSKPWLTCYLIKLNSWCLGHRKEELQDRCVSNAGGRGLGVLGLLVTSDRNPIWTRRIEGEKILVQKIQRRFEGPNWEKGEDPALLRSAQKQEHKSSLHLSFSAFLYKKCHFSLHISLFHMARNRDPPRVLLSFTTYPQNLRRGTDSLLHSSLKISQGRTVIGPDSVSASPELICCEMEAIVHVHKRSQQLSLALHGENKGRSSQNI